MRHWDALLWRQPCTVDSAGLLWKNSWSQLSRSQSSLCCTRWRISASLGNRAYTPSVLVFQLLSVCTTSTSCAIKDTGHHHLSLALFILRSRWVPPDHYTKSSTSALCSNHNKNPTRIETFEYCCRFARLKLYWRPEMYKVNRNGDSKAPYRVPLPHIDRSDRGLLALCRF